MRPKSAWRDGKQEGKQSSYASFIKALWSVKGRRQSPSNVKPGSLTSEFLIYVGSQRVVHIFKDV